MQYTIIGYISDIRREDLRSPNSPRFCLTVNGLEYWTAPNSTLGFMLSEHDKGKRVRLLVKDFRRMKVIREYHEYSASAQ